MFVLLFLKKREGNIRGNMYTAQQSLLELLCGRDSG